MYKIIRNFNVEKIIGIGETTAEKLQQAGITTIDLLAQTTPLDINKKTGIPIGLSNQHHAKARIAIEASVAIGDINNTQECSECNGKGVVYHDETCPHCNGTAKITFEDKDPCTSCAAQGIVTKKTMEDCSVCNGKGTVALETPVSCSICHGTGIERYTKITNCPTCHGSGSIWQHYKKICGYCGGDGIAYRKWHPKYYTKKTCPDCHGKKYTQGNVITNVLLSIFLPFGFGSWRFNKCPTCDGHGTIRDYTPGYWEDIRCTHCNGSGSIYSSHKVDCPNPHCVKGKISEIATRSCTACGGDGKQTTTTTGQCKACSGLGKTLNISREKCSDCDGSGTIIEQHEIGCPSCGEKGILIDFEESKCLYCNGKGTLPKEISDFSGINLETFVRFPTEKLVSSSTLDEPTILAMKRGIGTLFTVLDESSLDELML